MDDQSVKVSMNGVTFEFESVESAIAQFNAAFGGAAFTSEATDTKPEEVTIEEVEQCLMKGILNAVKEGNSTEKLEAVTAYSQAIQRLQSAKY